DGDYFTIEYIDAIVVDATTFYNGAGNSNVPNTTDGCYKLLVKNTADGTLSLTENADVREVEIEASGKLVVNTDIRLQVSNEINNNGEIRLIGTSQLLQTHTGVSQITGTGDLYKDQASVNTDVYQSGYWTSPVTTNGTTFTIDGVLKDGTTPTSATSIPIPITFTDIHTLDGSLGPPLEISGRWLAKLINATDWTREISPTAITFNPGEGWNMKGLGANFTFKGIANDGDYTSSIDQNMLSLIGNPYPSGLDATQFINDNVEGSANSAIVGTLYFWEGGDGETHERGNYSGGYATRTLVGGTAFNSKIPSQYIGVGQSFFVWRSEAGTGTIQFKNSQRVFQILGGDNEFFGKGITKKETTDMIPKLRFGFEFVVDAEKIFHRQLLIAFMGLTNDYDNGYDGEMFDRQPTDIALKTNDWPSDFVITAIEDFNEDLEIPLSIYLDQKRDVTFKIDSLENLTTKVYLKDTMTNMYYNLTENNASVTLEIDSGNYLDRFFIVFKEDATMSTEDESITNDFIVYFDKNNNEIIVSSSNDLALNSMEINNFLGQKIVKKTYNFNERKKDII
ncbi:MAG: hypothetical protein JKY02_00620, partial [Flavobacteriaceae bacterium]|nr:hypothetical protein [Flavobacteriaceae bacterium]